MAINILSVIVAALSYMIIGSFWYSPSGFGNEWMRLTGIKMKNMSGAKKNGMTATYIAAFLGALVMALVLEMVLEYMGASRVTTGIATGFLMWLGFIATTTSSSVLWEGKPIKLYVLNNSCLLLSLLVMGAILGAWQ